jgi:hypothetical protein
MALELYESTSRDDLAPGASHSHYAARPPVGQGVQIGPRAGDERDAATQKHCLAIFGELALDSLRRQDQWPASLAVTHLPG